jgi:adenylate kinase family enzyme
MLFLFFFFFFFSLSIRQAASKLIFDLFGREIFQSRVVKRSFQSFQDRYNEIDSNTLTRTEKM